MTRRGWTLLIVVFVILGFVAIYLLSFHKTAEDPAAFKAAFVENCLTQANDAAQKQNRPYNEEQKRMLQTVCSCAADRSLTTLKPAEMQVFMANPADPAMFDRLKPILEDCARAARLPGANP
jgi:hypothetical protein